MKVKLAILLLLAMVSAGSAFAADINDLSWMAGQWRGDYRGLPMEAFYSTPSGEMILGQTKIANGEKVEFFEFEAFRQEGNSVVLDPMPFGKTGVRFTVKEMSPSRCVFENPQHDFPQRIIYELKPNGQLWSRIEGMKNGMPASDDFVFSKVGTR